MTTEPLSPDDDPDPFADDSAAADGDSKTDAMGINMDDPIDAMLVGKPVEEDEDSERDS